jgi:glycosyltransferase involved in cell wall biosynthesis
LKLLNCVISFQRLPYLRNTVESLLEFFKLGDTLIVDNGSKDTELHRYLDRLEARGVSTLRRGWRGDRDPVRVGYHEGMNEAIDYAAEKGYDYVQFVEDDMQFMWHDPSVLEKVERVFVRRPDASWVCPIFFDRSDPLCPENLEPSPAVNGYRDALYSAHTTGFMPVSLSTEHGFRFTGEEHNERYLKVRGFHVYYLHSPVAAWLPWAAGYRYGKLEGSIRPPAKEYYLKPLTQAQIDSLTQRPLSDIPYDDRYCRPWGWAALKPYLSYLRDDRDYARRLLSLWRKGRPVVPIWTSAGLPRYIEPPLSIYLGLFKHAALLILRKLFSRLIPSGQRQP